MSFNNSSSALAARQTDDPDSPFRYIPTAWICLLFFALYGISAFVHLAQAVNMRVLWMLPTAFLAGFAETIGWSARVWASQVPDSLLAFKIQMVATILAPTPLIAANFMILGKLINHLGTRYSRLPAKYYTIVFTEADMVSLIVQALGGIVASKNVGVNPKGTELGGHIMLGGIVVSMTAITIFVILAAEFFYRFAYDKPVRFEPSSTPSYGQSYANLPNRQKIAIYSLVFTTTCLFIRAVYRTIELTDGFTGKIISTEILFNILDGAMVALAICTLNACHPGILLNDILRPAAKGYAKVEDAFDSETAAMAMAGKRATYLGSDAEGRSLYAISSRV